MGVTPRELVARYSAKELREQMMWDELEPHGWRRLDYWFSLLICTIMNVNVDRKKRPEGFSPKDFMPPRIESADDYKPVTGRRVREVFSVLRGSLKKKRKDPTPRGGAGVEPQSA